MEICRNMLFMLCEIKHRAKTSDRDVHPSNVNEAICSPECHFDTEMSNDDV